MANASYTSDSALRHATADRFGRAGFAKSLAKTISSLNDPSSIVIGLYGPWGDGKFSVLNFLLEAFHEVEAHTNVLTLEFNPWRFHGEDEMLAMFCGALAQRVDVNLQTALERAAKTIDPFLRLFPKGDQVREASRHFFSASVEELKGRVEELLETQHRRVVVIMDDIDRLEPIEIQAVFRLIKLTASFNYVVYVIACDEGIVADALSQRFNGDREAGLRFLEKIVQVPLRLPRIEDSAMAEFRDDCVRDAMNSATVAIDANSRDRFLKWFGYLIAPRLTTPRMSKRFGNILAFVLGLLREEADVADLMLIEGVRLCYPKLYAFVRENESFLVGVTTREQHRLRYGNRSTDEILIEAVSATVSGSQGGEHDLAVVEWLREAFPRMGLQGELESGEFSGHLLEDGQNIGSPYYFHRFFTYTVPHWDIPDKEIGNLLSAAKCSDASHTVKQIIYLASGRPDESDSGLLDSLRKSVLRGRLVEQLVCKLLRRRRLLEPALCPTLAISIAKAADSLYSSPSDQTLWDPTSLELLMRQLVLNTSTLNLRAQLVQNIMQEATSLVFFVRCFRTLLLKNDSVRQHTWYHSYTTSQRDDNDEPLDESRFAEIRAKLALRIGEFCQSGELSRLKKNDGIVLLEEWLTCTDKDVRTDVLLSVGQTQSTVRALLGWFVADYSIVENSQLNRVHRLVERERFASAVRQVYSPVLGLDNASRQEPSEPDRYDLVIAARYLKANARMGSPPLA